MHQQRDRRRQRAAANERPAADDKPGKHVTIGFAGPQADHGWLNAINDNAKSRAKKYADVSLEITEGSNDTAQQIGQIETLINTERRTYWSSCPPTARRSPRSASRRCAPASRSSTSTASSTPRRRTAAGSAVTTTAWALNAGRYIGEKLKDKPDARVVELAGWTTWS
ncbi:hypothetical protein GCM10017687_87700 [Streptomyces echinatus]|uniref:hypothetical protein n=1 Tax=Streptomyces echinatus TaxID=67293 RepID=UPI0031ED3DF8